MSATAVSPDARRIWRAARGPALIGLVIVLAAMVLAAVTGSAGRGGLDPDSARPEGGRALARLLAGQGVRIQPVRTAADARAELASGPATLLVTAPNLVVTEQLAVLRVDAAELVLIGADQDTVAGLGLPVRAGPPVQDGDREPDCGLTAASVAGTATTGGATYEVRDGVPAQRCYPDGGAPTLVRLAGPDPVTLLGTATPLSNAVLAEQGNAALAMRLLGGYQRLVWYLPSPADPSLRPDRRPLLDLLPAGWRWGLVQVTVAVLLLALWRARRLGPVVTEPLPVVVTAAETVEGRARLYRRAGAADHAGAALRAAAVSRLADRFGLPANPVPAAVVTAVATRTGRAPAEVHEVLYGPPPADDAALVRLATALDALETADTTGTVATVDTVDS